MVRACHKCSMLEYMFKHGYYNGKAWCTSREIADDTGQSITPIQGTLTRLYYDDRVDREAISRNPNTFKYTIWDHDPVTGRARHNVFGKDVGPNDL